MDLPYTICRLTPDELARQRAHAAVALENARAAVGYDGLALYRAIQDMLPAVLALKGHDEAWLQEERNRPAWLSQTLETLLQERGFVDTTRVRDEPGVSVYRAHHHDPVLVLRIKHDPPHYLLYQEDVEGRTEVDTDNPQLLMIKIREVSPKIEVTREDPAALEASTFPELCFVDAQDERYKHWGLYSQYGSRVRLAHGTFSRAGSYRSRAEAIAAVQQIWQSCRPEISHNTWRYAVIGAASAAELPPTCVLPDLLPRPTLAIERDLNGRIDGLFCNDPANELDVGTLRSQGLPAGYKGAILNVPYGTIDDDCGSCGGCHLKIFHGDCREDNNRFCNNS